MSFEVGKNIPVKIVKTYLEAAKTGNQCVVVEVRNDEGDTLWWRGWLSDAAIERTIDVLEEIGWDRNAYDCDIDSLDGTDCLVGNDARVTTEMREYEDKQRVEIAWLNGVGRRGEAVSAEGKAALRERIKRMGGARPAVAAKPVPEAAGPIKDSDTPF